MADHKFQMADGSYPIDACTGENSVASAAKLAHNSKTHSFAEVKAHVMKAKNALKCSDSVLPESWGEGSSSARPPRNQVTRRVERLSALARHLQKSAPRLSDRLPALTRAAEAQESQDGDWDEDSNHLAQAIDASLDEALEAFQASQVDQGVALVVAAAATGDALLEALNLPDADEVSPEPANAGRTRNGRPPRDSLIRGVFPLELRDADGKGMPTLFGHFAVFGRWTEIDSVWEGQFMEQLAPGAFKKTMQENRSNMRVLFNHGKDPAIGDKVLGPIEDLREDENGAYYEVPLLDTSYNRDLLPGLEAGLYGASFRFSVMKEAMNQKPQRSDWNPEGLPERTIQEVALREFGPVTFPAYTEATAGIRSLTDDFIVRQLVGDPERLQSLLNQHSALSRPGAEPAHSEVREPQQPPRWPQISREEFLGKSRSGRTPFNP